MGVGNAIVEAVVLNRGRIATADHDFGLAGQSHAMICIACPTVVRGIGCHVPVAHAGVSCVFVLRDAITLALIRRGYFSYVGVRRFLLCGVRHAFCLWCGDSMSDPGAARRTCDSVIVAAFVARRTTSDG